MTGGGGGLGVVVVVTVVGGNVGAIVGIVGGMGTVVCDGASVPTLGDASAPGPLRASPRREVPGTAGAVVVGGTLVSVGAVVGVLVLVPVLVPVLVLVSDATGGMVKDTGGARAKRAVGPRAAMTAMVVPPASMIVAASLYVQSLCLSLVLTGMLRI